MVAGNILSLLALSIATGLFNVGVYAAPVPQYGLTQDQIDSAYISEGGFITVSGRPPAQPDSDALGGKFATVVDPSDYAYAGHFQKDGKSVLVAAEPQSQSAPGSNSYNGSPAYDPEQFQY
ncbi:hypothetical protein TWF281_006092 [Arthrobotrys megalospora]